MPDVGEVKYKVTLDTSDVEQDSKKTENAIQQAAKSAEKATENAAQKIKSGANEAQNAIKKPTAATNEFAGAINEISANQLDKVGNVASSVGQEMDSLKKSANDSSDSFKKIENSADSAGSKLKNSLAAGAKAAAAGIKVAATAAVTAAAAIGTAAVAGVVSLGKVGVEFNSQMEGYQTSFEVMTGSAEEAERITEQLKQTAASTPFGMQDLAETTQLLMNYGLSADDAMNSMEMLGDISQGSADKLNRISEAYGKMSSFGKVQLEQIDQMIEAGFNPLQEISETTGESMESLYNRISKGTLSVDEITASMQRSTSEGGKYYQSMEKQSQTLAGQFSTLKDYFFTFAGEVTEGLIPAFGSVMDSINEIFADETLKETLSSVFDSIAQMATEALPPLMDALSENIPLLAEIVESILPVFLDLFSQILPSLIEFSEAILPVMLDMIQQILPPLMELVEAILPVISELLLTLLPPLMEIISAVLPVLVEVLNVLLPIITSLLEILTPILDMFMQLLQPILDLISVAVVPLIEVIGELINVAIVPLQEVLNVLFAAFQSVFSGILENVSSAISTIQGIFEGLIQFISGIFSGNWQQAWDGIVKIFSSIWEGIKNLAKAPINGVIDIINGFLSGLNNIKIPDWIPVIGGAGFSIPLIPRLEKGMPFVPSDFFPAYLDYGERVLTQDENAVLNSIGGFPTVQRIAQNIVNVQPFDFMKNQNTKIEVPLYLDGREIARASAWYMGEQLAWEER